MSVVVFFFQNFIYLIFFLAFKNLKDSPEAAAFPAIAFKLASVIWTKNMDLLKTNFGTITDGTFHSFCLITHRFTNNAEDLKKRAIYYEDLVQELSCLDIKRGRGVQCELKNRFFSLFN
jgi:hypothetical protein